MSEGNVVSGYVRYNVAQISTLGRLAFLPSSLVLLGILITQVLNGFGFFQRFQESIFIYGLITLLVINALQFSVSILDRRKEGA